MREAAGAIWASLPDEERNAEQLQSEALRLIMRVIENFCDDLATFTKAPGAEILARTRARGSLNSASSNRRNSGRALRLR